MKKTIYTLFVMLLVGCLVAMGQIKPIKRQKSTKQKTEKTVKPKMNSSSNNSGKSKKQNKTSPQQPPSSTSDLSLSSESDLSVHPPKMSILPVVQQAIEDMVWIEGGTFTMGATVEQGSDASNDEMPAHRVTLSGYYISKYEVTQELWIAVMGSNPSKFKGNQSRPVEQVSWSDCQQFLYKLNAMTGKNFRFPTEAEWEFAARGGKYSLGYKYSGGNNINSVAIYYDNSSRSTFSVGYKSPNELGLYDMSGNVNEWCEDGYGSYSNEIQTNPTGSSRYEKVYRGGSWDNKPRFCRVSDRYYNSSNYTSYNLGLRLAASSL